MTKVTLRYDLSRPLTDEDLQAISDMHSTFGIARVHLATSLDKIVLDYDASRLKRTDVDSLLARFAIPVKHPATV
jgi:hypothetical protein